MWIINNRRPYHNYHDDIMGKNMHSKICDVDIKNCGPGDRPVICVQLWVSGKCYRERQKKATKSENIIDRVYHYIMNIVHAFTGLKKYALHCCDLFQNVKNII